VYDEPELARALRKATPSTHTPRVMHDTKSLSLTGLDSGPGARRAQALASSLMKNTALPWGVGYARSYASSEEGAKFQFWRDSVSYRRALLDVFGIGHLVLPSDAAFGPEAKLERLHQFDGIGAAVYQNPSALPFAFPVAHVGVVDGFETATRALADPRIARGQLAVLGPLSAPLSTTGSSGEGQCVPVGPILDQIVIECELPAPSWVVINESHHPNWSASIDGQTAELVPANALVMATHVPAGKRRVVLGYEEPSLLLGLLVSLFAGLLTLLLVARDRRRASA
jgi:hypothetical protein